MERGLTVILAVSLLVSCARGGTQAQLARLRARRDRISERIRRLEEGTEPGKGAPNTSPESKRAGATPVSVTVIERRRFDHFVEVQGRLDGEENVSVNPKIGGVVVSKLAGVGDRVSRSQVLALLDDAALAEQIQGARAQLDLARETYTRKVAISDQKIYSEMDYLKDKTQMDVAEKNLASLLEQAEMYKIRSPIDGTVAEASFKVGQTLNPAQATPAYRIVNFSRLKVTAEVSEAYAAKIKKGDEVWVYFPDLGRGEKTTVSFASDFINPANRTFTVEAPVLDSTRGLKVNMLAVMKINDYRADGALAVSVNAVLGDRKGGFVFVAEEENGATVARRRYVTLGQVYDGTVEVTAGLREGDRVITVGFRNVEDGDPVSL